MSRQTDFLEWEQIRFAGGAGWRSAALIIHGMHESERIAEGLHPCSAVRGGVKDRRSPVV